MYYRRHGLNSFCPPLFPGLGLLPWESLWHMGALRHIWRPNWDGCFQINWWSQLDKREAFQWPGFIQILVSRDWDFWRLSTDSNQRPASVQYLWRKVETQSGCWLRTQEHVQGAFSAERCRLQPSRGLRPAFPLRPANEERSSSGGKHECTPQSTQSDWNPT